MDDWLAFLGIYLAEGYAVKEDSKKAKEGNYEVGIICVKPKVKKEIRKILKKLPFEYRETKDRFIILDKQLWSYLRKLGDCYTKYIPQEFKKLSPRQLRILLDAFNLGDGMKIGKRRLYYTSSKKLQDDIGELILKVGHSPRYYTRKDREIYIGSRRLHPNKNYPNLIIAENVSQYYTFTSKKYRGKDGKANFKKISYQGYVYSVEVPNHVVFVRRKGTCAWSGNTRVGFQSPFTNVTLDLVCPSHLANQPVIVGGKIQNKTYKEFKKEQDLFNKIFLEVMREGDAKGRPFTFPIPTYNITRDFDWDSKDLNLLWEITARYGIPYFANFVNSDMKPEDARSMCLHPDEEIVIRKNGKIIKTTVGKLVESEVKKFDSDGWSDAKNVIEVLSFNPENYQIEWVKIKRFLKVKDDILITVRTMDGKEMRISQNHLVAVYTPNGIKTKLAKNLEKNDILLTTRKAQNIFKQNYQMIGTKKLDEKLGYLVGFFVADGNYLYDSRYEKKRIRGIQFNFNTTDQQQQLIIKRLVQDIYDYELKFIQDPRYKNSLRGYLYRTDIAKEWITTGIEKYNNIPEIILNSPLSIIQAFLEGFFRGDGYEKGKEIHINDEGLARDLVILMTLAGVNCTYRKRENSQVIRIQHTLGRGAKYTNIVVDSLYNRVPQFLVKTSCDKPFYNKNVMPCKSSLDRREAHTEESIKILNSGLALVKIESIEIEHLPYKQDFYDIELDKNHYFVHSLGNITHNCCRLRIDNRKLEKRGGGLFGSSPLTGSIGVVTINMPRIGYLSKTESEFFQRLSYLMELAKESLEIKRKILEILTERDLYPYAKFYLRNIKKRFGQYWKNHFSTIGLVGMNEACLNFLKKDLGSKGAIEFALKVLDFMREKLLEFQEETGNNYNLEATPAEGCSYRLSKLDKKKYPEIICANESKFREGAQPFYTNSTQLPVNFTDDIFEALELQDEIQSKYTGGTTLHIFIGEKIENPQIVKKLVKNICNNYHLPYFTITPTFSICPQHGYISGEYKVCPECGSQCEVYSRVVGYLRPVSSWNDGKQEEFGLRKVFKVR
ncbi:MAG: hypothetical protein J7K37_00105 [Candidatus Omnitrophica bacterium]|nr:hypothetical protein [Candidatus Omnitrophota bacterium]